MSTNDASDDSGAGFGMIPRHLRGQLTINEIGVYIGLSWRANQYGQLWIRHKRLAREVGASVSTVQRALRGLRDKGIVSWVPKIDDDGNTECNVYTLHVFHQAPPPGQYDRGGRSIRPGGPVVLTDRTRTPERDTMNEEVTGSAGLLPETGAAEVSSSSSPPVTREPRAPMGDAPGTRLGAAGRVAGENVTTTNKPKLSAVQILAAGAGEQAGITTATDRRAFHSWLRTDRGITNPTGLILSWSPEALEEHLEAWRLSLDPTSEDYVPKVCDHGHDVTAGDHRCPTCRAASAVVVDVEPCDHGYDDARMCALCRAASAGRTDAAVADALVSAVEASPVVEPDPDGAWMPDWVRQDLEAHQDA